MCRGQRIVDGATLIVIDVDGTMTDGGIYYDNFGNELKKFNTRDAAGFFAARAIGAKIMVLTGRECPATVKRMKELHVDYLEQNVTNKTEFLQRFMIREGYKKQDVIYIGDDLNDITSMKLCGYVACPADACVDVRTIADYVSSVCGGSGVIRDVVEHLLRQNNEWENVVNEIYGGV